MFLDGAEATQDSKTREENTGQQGGEGNGVERVGEDRPENCVLAEDGSRGPHYTQSDALAGSGVL